MVRHGALLTSLVNTKRTREILPLIFILQNSWNDIIIVSIKAIKFPPAIAHQEQPVKLPDAADLHATDQAVPAIPEYCS